MSDEIKGRARGGVAKAAGMTPDKRKELSQKMLAAKKGIAKLPKATHSGMLKIGDVEILCFVLDDGRRVVSGRGLTSAIGMKGRGQGTARISGHKLIKSYNNNALSMSIESPIKFVGKSPKGASVPSDGFEAIILQEVCEAILTAQDNGLVTTEQEQRYAKQANILMRGFARVGIIALVDEATGYQRDRAKDALAKILEAYVAKEIQPWIRTFDVAYYEQMFRLRGLPYPPEKANYRPSYFGHLTNDVVYSRLAPGVLSALKDEAKKDEKKTHLHRHLTAGFGRQELLKHLGLVVGFMKDSSNWKIFMEKLNRISPRYNTTIPLDIDEADR